MAYMDYMDPDVLFIKYILKKNTNSIARQVKINLVSSWQKMNKKLKFIANENLSYTN